MEEFPAIEVLDLRDQRLIAALQCDGRLTAGRAAEVLGVGPRVVRRRWAALLDGDVVRVRGVVPYPPGTTATLLRIRVLRGRVEAIAAALAARDDVPFIDLSAGGDEIGAIVIAPPGSRGRLLYRQLPATGAVTSVTAQTVLHVFSTADAWRHDVLTPEERRALTPQAPPPPAGPPDDTDRRILGVLAADGRASAAAIAERTGLPDSTVRRRLAARGHLRTQVIVDPRRLGLAIDANVWMRIEPGRLDEVGRALAAHPAVHGALATTGEANLQVAVWLRDLEHLYRFVSGDLGALGVRSADTVLVGRAVKRPG
ncbi:AsnC family transcriptional regulator [Actinomadura macrotermitis]|uniref:HTH asnC-type domain-containing protein n=1 Tax=Actinomadura macrotermitis TaxID=2585200 RepID=A0A7K0C2S0_9ACTN|nr:AsnC family transcriptional regulator [Actinomadura macrotermitis]MQY07124.1 hypothetical protein [Actinomadura macrotermitis]